MAEPAPTEPEGAAAWFEPASTDRESVEDWLIWTSEDDPFPLISLPSDEELEAAAVVHGWFRDSPGAVTRRWLIAAGVVGVIGVGMLFAAANLPSGGLILLGIAAIAAALVWLIFARWMPARTMPGAVIRAMLAAYRRTLQKTMEQSRSMNQVVQNAGLSWIETPDQATVWGVALGLQSDVEAVIERSAEDVLVMEHCRASAVDQAL